MIRVVAPVAILLLCATCAPSTPNLAPGPERAGGVLDQAVVESIAVLLQHEDLRRFDPAVFRELAASTSPEVRRRTATAAGRIGDHAAAALLMDMLSSDPSPTVRADAAFAIGLLGDTSTVVIQSLRAAAPRDWIPVRPEETTIVVEVVGALGQLGTDPARAQLLDALRRAHPALDDPHSRRIAAEALLAVWRVPAGPGRVLSVVRFLDHPDPELRWRAALALVRMADPTSTQRMLSLLGDPDPRVRSLAARGVSAAMADSAGVAESAIEALVPAVEDDHPHVRIHALRALATFGERAPEDVIAAALGDRDRNVAVAAAGALASLGPRSVGPLATFATDPSAPVGPAAAALAELAALKPEAALPTLQAWAGLDLERRYGAARALTAVGWERGATLLERLAGDADPRVAVAATAAAASLAGDPDLSAEEQGRIRDLLLRAAAAEDPRQRPPALRGLSSLLRRQDLPHVLAAYERAAADPAARPAAIAAIRALGAMEQAGIEAAAAFFDRFRRHEDRWIARAVADVLGSGWGAAPPAVMGEGLDFYRDIVGRYVVPALADGRRPTATIGTEQGDIRLELLAEEAPLTVYNFVTLAGAGLYDDGVWHRVVPAFVLQDGAPAGDPSGGAGWSIRDEINRVRYLRGVLGMAHSGPDTGGSQWFITHSPQPHLDGGYTAFGRVTAGERVMDRVVQGDPIQSVRIHH